MQTYIEMAKPMQMMMTNMNKGEPMPFVDAAIEFAVALGKVMAVFGEEYDGGEFCKGMLFSKEASKVVFKVGSMLMSPMKSAAPETSIADEKKLALESRLRRH